jgi:hypothetical protein
LAAGRFEEGWREYEWRWKSKHLASSHRGYQQPQWCGEDAAGKTLFIYVEQGFGDTLQFCRYVPLVKARGMNVVLEVQPALMPLMTSLQGVDHLMVQGQEPPDFDLYCPMLSLPLAFNTRLETIPGNTPYLVAQAFAVKTWHEKMPDAKTAKGTKRVGLVWAGSARGQTQDLKVTDRQRSMAPELMEPLLKVPGIRFYSLQKTAPLAPASFGLIDYMDECKNFADTAALIMNLDLVISVDTAVVHLAGALGKPVWMLNRFNSCWRWLQEREDSPWYPTMRLFHQPTPGDWESVVARVSAELGKLGDSRN